jgi:hypothetical protein
MVCYAEYKFDQDTYEAGPLAFVASAKPTEMPQAVTSSPATVNPVYTTQWAFYQGACVEPTAARKSVGVLLLMARELGMFENPRGNFS